MMTQSVMERVKKKRTEVEAAIMVAPLESVMKEKYYTTKNLNGTVLGYLCTPPPDLLRQQIFY